MEALTIKASKTFLRQHDAISEWYATQMGQKALLKYLDDLESTIRDLSRFPRMGIIDERRTKDKRKYYTFLLHPHYRIVYRFTRATLYLITFQAIRMNH
ncbi:MAG TPA: type II toxin-antitoxin system RelE/ParE family toxin [Candidatus Parabacteroides intestinigallinarum]|uniref:Type II toxin-antitoxin system RelE/ParE family toxin n=1 Tax=Candidatus Parabacteroides intestinigallinarum TaxID=2838722 RepID=A0A9D2BQL1_9BACT|nr:type II toxin-antitoxin system RelE/ParE family toxin [Candidatus Parabacteroides intestinigallinarum]